jgi:hypothetical protein
MGPVLVVVFSPRLELHLRIFERHEPVLFKILLTKSYGIAVTEYGIRILKIITGIGPTTSQTS